MLLSRNEIRAINDRPMQRVPIPEMGKDAEIMVRMMSAHNREIYESWAMRYSEKKAEGSVEPQELYALMAVLSCCDESGDPLFSLDDIGWLSQKSFVALKRIFDVAWKLNLFDPEEVENAANFLEVTPEPASGSDLPLPSEPQ